MRGMRAVGTAVLALALTSGIAGSAQAVNGPVQSGKAAPAAVKDVAGYEIVTATGTVGDTITACCPAGKQATGGGVDSEHDQATVVKTRPVSDGSGWIGRAERAGTNDIVTVYAVCA